MKEEAKETRAFAATCRAVFERAIADYHRTDSVDAACCNPYAAGSIEAQLYEKAWTDAVQWHLEDAIRAPQLSPAEALQLKRRIDRLNQQRTDLVEGIDDYFLSRYRSVAVAADATLNTESPAWAIDRLSILALKIAHMRQEVARTDGGEAHAEACGAKLAVLTEQQSDLCAAIDQLLADIAAGRKRMKVYRQMKMYNDPSLNPVLYGQGKLRGRRILVIRLSAMGDVALLVPALYSVAECYAADRFVLLTKDAFLPLFEHRPANVSVMPVFTGSRHKGLLGLLRLIGELSKEGFDAVADMHNVLRSQVIRRYFRLKGKQVGALDKGRQEKRALVRRRHKRLRPLKTAVDRYREVFRTLGYDCPLTFRSNFNYGNKTLPSLDSLISIRTLFPHGKGACIGVAPFARHRGKTYPLAKMEEVVATLARRPQTVVFLFGSPSEAALLKAWAQKYERVVCLAGRLPLASELVAMRAMDVMLTMDSANMHLASLMGVPVVSVWGATHPFAGFMGYGQSLEHAVQLDLPCRPCSVFGNRRCRRHYACLANIAPEDVIDRVNRLLKGKE